jgi:glutamate-1-semialdehyde 2,1-aminomutase
MESIEYGKVLHYGSHNAPRLGLYAAKTMLEEMSRDNNAGWAKINAIGEEVTQLLNQVAKDTGQNMRVQNVGSMFHPVFTALEEIPGYRDFCGHVDLAKYGRFSQLMRDQGVFFSGNRILHNLSCTAHTQADIDRTIAAAGNALEQL